MPERKAGTPTGAKSGTTPGASTSSTETTSGTKEGRKPWVKKTPVEVVLEQFFFAAFRFRFREQGSSQVKTTFAFVPDERDCSATANGAMVTET